MSQIIYTQDKKKARRVSALLVKNKDILFLKKIALIGQEAGLFQYFKEGNISLLVKMLKSIDRFYQSIGGIEGYQKKILQVLHLNPTKQIYDPVEAVNSEQGTFSEDWYVQRALESIELFAEFIPLGGAAERFNSSRKEKNAQALELFLGLRFLEILIQDVFAREYLYFKKTGIQVKTPIFIMCSSINENHKKLMTFIKQKKYFGRDSNRVKIYQQPLVPIVDSKGDWCLSSSKKLEFKPSGHGAIWNLAKQKGVYRWVEKLGVKYIVARQINNPLSGLDHGLLSFFGYGIEQKKSFGFICVKRNKKMQEGICVLKNINGKKVISSVEYFDAKKYDFNQKFKFSNTNILFAKLDSLKQAIAKTPFPGLLLNFKNDNKARLESTMQMISESVEGSQFLMLIKRHKVLSVIKKIAKSDSVELETAQSSLFDHCLNQYDLLKNHCKMQVPINRKKGDFVAKGPSFLFTYLRALGPTYKEIAKKIVGGRIHAGSVFDLQIIQLHCSNLQLKGSLSIRSVCPYGSIGDDGQVMFSSKAASCRLENVTIDLKEHKKELALCAKNPNNKPICLINIVLEEESSLVVRNMHFNKPITIVVKKAEHKILEGMAS